MAEVSRPISYYDSLLTETTNVDNITATDPAHTSVELFGGLGLNV